MKEIGGYQAFGYNPDGEFYSDAAKFNLARTALKYLIRAKGIKKIYIPYFMCDSVINACKDESCRVEFYHIGKDFRPMFDKHVCEGEALYLANYYGQISEEEIATFYGKFGERLIVDNAQAFFSRPCGADTVYTCRKFFPVADGAYLFSSLPRPEDLVKDRSSDRMRHVLTRCEDTASAHYGEFTDTERAFETADVLEMSELTQALMSVFDYAFVKATRERNFGVLADALSGVNGIDVVRPEGPFCYPLYVENAQQIKSRLLENKIYVPTLWPNVLSLPQDFYEHSLAANVLPLPCDQRYTVDDMKLVAALCAGK